MTATKCGWCSAYASMTLHGDKSVAYISRDGDPFAVQAPFLCNHCGRVLIASAEYEASPGFRGPSPDDTWWWDALPKDAIIWTPEQVSGKEFPDVPQHIASAADEAYRCQSIKAFRGAIMLARAVIEATAKDHEIVKGMLVNKIDEMEKQGIVRGYTKDAAHEVRHLGNDMAHGDFVDPTEADDVEAVLVVMSSILEEVYQGPARVKAMKDKREGGAAQV